MGRTEKVVSRLQNPRAQLPVVANPTNPSAKRRSKLPTIPLGCGIQSAYISLVNRRCVPLRLLYHLSHKGGNRTSPTTPRLTEGPASTTVPVGRSGVYSNDLLARLRFLI